MTSSTPDARAYLRTGANRRGCAMLRITVHDKPGALTFQLEGSLAGPGLRELEACWQGARARRRNASLRVDLTEVTFVDAAGRDCLSAMHRQGAKFLAADCVTEAVAAEITLAPLPQCGGPQAEVERGAVTDSRCDMTANATA